MREILFKTKQVLRDSSTQGNKLLRTFIDVVDLYEMSMESHDDYSRIRNEFLDTPILEKYRFVILNMARELEQAAMAIHNHEEFVFSFVMMPGEWPLKLHQLDILPVQFRRDARVPVVVD